MKSNRQTKRVPNSSVIGVYDGIKAISKLSDLEDIEEKLGIDLVTLFKALKNGAAVKFDDRIVFIPKEFVSIHCSYLFVDYNMPKVLGFKDYGETWALTKEELL